MMLAELLSLRPRTFRSVNRVTGHELECFLSWLATDMTCAGGLVTSAAQTVLFGPSTYWRLNACPSPPMHILKP